MDESISPFDDFEPMQSELSSEEEDNSPPFRSSPSLEEDATASSHGEDEEETPTTATSLPLQPSTVGDSAFILPVRIVFSASSCKMPILIARKYIQDVIEQAGARVLRRTRCASIPHAEYERANHEFNYDIELSCGEDDNSRRLSVSAFIDAFCDASFGGLHMQISLELPTFNSLFHDIKAEERNVDVTSFSVGHCPSGGLFFVRGDYFSRKNDKPSNQKLADERKKRGGDGIEPAAGRHRRMLSFANLEHDWRKFWLNFVVPLTKPRADGLAFSAYKLMFHYSAIRSIVLDARDKKHINFFIHLKHPPHVWKLAPKIDEGGQVLEIDARDAQWERVTKWPASDGSIGCSQKTLGDNNWLRISFSRGQQQPRKPLSMEERCSTLHRFVSILARLCTRCPSIRIQFAGVTSVKQRQAALPAELPSVGSFRADYALKAIVARGSVVTDDIFGDHRKNIQNFNSSSFIKTVVWCMTECQEACEEALEGVLGALEEKRNIEVIRCFDSIYSNRVNMYRRCQMEMRPVEAVRLIPPNCVLIRRVMVTPLRILPMPPDTMMTNRVVRRFGAEHAMRVVFRDDNGNKLQPGDFSLGPGRMGTLPKLLTEMVKSTMAGKVRICRRDYFFLAWSNSQMRDHGCYMYASHQLPSGEEVTIDSIRQWMGDFSQSKTVPKLMSRMGQCFTQAQPVVMLSPSDWILEEDVEGGVGHPETGEAYCFSDGVGRLSLPLARLIATKLDLRIIPGCFQVRFKGFKGVLTVDRSLEAGSLTPRVIFRKSQKKFVDSGEDKPSMLEVVKYAMPSPVCINRQLITIMEACAANQSKRLHARLCSRIHYYLEKELSIISSMLISDSAAAAALTERLPLPIDFRRLTRTGFSLTSEPLFRRILVACYHHAVSQHLAKAKLELPSWAGRCMYGVMDETGLLQNGQVFIQYSPGIRNPSHQPLLHLGPVLVSKNPCHSAGDVRVLEAVWQPALAHLVDVIVFPRYGPRPHSDEMAGGDLDGDEYSVLFDSDMMLDYSEKAMSFPKMAAQQYEFTPTSEDMAEFFLNYLKQDAIGVVSNAHLHMADKKGLFNETCEDLARKCSIAVDFPKSGQPSEPLEREEKLMCLPDFAEKPYRPSYRSEKLNGQIFRRVKRIEDVMELCEKSESVFENVIDPVLFNEAIDVWEGNERLKRDTIRLRNEYATEIQQLMDEYGISSEAAVVSGKVVTVKRLSAMEKDDYTFYNTEKIIELRVHNIFTKYRKIFFNEFGEEEDMYETDKDGTRIIRTDSIMRRKARCWYVAAYVDEEGWRGEGAHSLLGLPCKSFPWVVWDVLAQFKQHESISHSGMLPTHENPVPRRLTEAMWKALDERATAYADFIKMIKEEDEAVERYSQTYGQELLHVLFVLHCWMQKTMPHCLLRPCHLSRLLIQFCLGQVHTAAGVHVDVKAVAVFPSKLMYGSSDCPPLGMAAIREPGELLLNFLIYLGSHAFSTASHLDLSLGDGCPSPSPVLTRPIYWLPLSNGAFHTLHEVCVSGNFSALGLEGEERRGKGWGEAPNPLVVSAALNDRRALDTLRKWTGVTDIVCRRDARNNKECILTVAGTAEARQQLARLLQMDLNLLGHAMEQDRRPGFCLDLLI